MSFSLPHLLKHTGGAVLDALLPPLCLSCDGAVGGHQTLCAACWSKIHFIAAPQCAACGVPFDVPMGDGSLCGRCIEHPPVYAAARAAMLYDDASKPIVLGFKHGDRTHAAEGLAQMMHRAGKEFLDNADMIMPVPLHRWRLFQRRYNQSAMLALRLGRLSGKKVAVDLLLRVRATPAQGHMNRAERQKNVKAAFALAPHHADDIRDKNIVLIDDVMTTGATVNECSQTLLDTGAQSVSVLTLARVRAAT